MTKNYVIKIESVLDIHNHADLDCLIALTVVVILRELVSKDRNKEIQKEKRNKEKQIYKKTTTNKKMKKKTHKETG